MRAWLIPLTLCLIAGCLTFSTLEYDVRPAKVQGDVIDYDWANGFVFPTRAPWRGWGAIIIGTGKYFPDERDVPLNTPFRVAFEGIYTRWGLPTAVAVCLELPPPSCW